MSQVPAAPGAADPPSPDQPTARAGLVGPAERPVPELVPAAADGGEEFVRAVARGFHLDFDADLMGPSVAVFEAPRCFGHRVGGRWVSTCGSFSRVLTVPGADVPAAAVSWVTVQPSYRRRGLLEELMTYQLRSVTEPVAVLWASEAGIYGRYGYGGAATSLQVSGPTRPTPFRPEVDLGDGWVEEVGAEDFRAVAEPLHAALLPGRPGALDRPPAWWDRVLDDHPSGHPGETAARHALHHDRSGRPDGWVSFRLGSTGGTDVGSGLGVRVTGMDAATPQGLARLWRFVLDLDLVRTVTATVAPDDPLPLFLADPRALIRTVGEQFYVRLVDLRPALAARRYPQDVDLVLGVRDPRLPANDGRFRLQGGLEGADVRPTAAAADVSLDVRELGALYLGGTSAAALQRAGLVTEHRPGAVEALTAAFSWPRQPWCPDSF